MSITGMKLCEPVGAASVWATNSLLARLARERHPVFAKPGPRTHNIQCDRACPIKSLASGTTGLDPSGKLFCEKERTRLNKMVERAGDSKLKSPAPVAHQINRRLGARSDGKQVHELRYHHRHSLDAPYRGRDRQYRFDPATEQPAGARGACGHHRAWCRILPRPEARFRIPRALRALFRRTSRPC